MLGVWKYLQTLNFCDTVYWPCMVTCDMWHGWCATMGPSGNFFRVPFSTMAASLQITTSWSPSPSQSREHLRSIPTSAGIFSLFSNFRFCNSAAAKRNKHLVNAPVWELPYIGLQAGGRDRQRAAQFLNFSNSCCCCWVCCSSCNGQLCTKEKTASAYQIVLEHSNCA